jgi:hypothetical protein
MCNVAALFYSKMQSYYCSATHCNAGWKTDKILHLVFSLLSTVFASAKFLIVKIKEKEGL